MNYGGGADWAGQDGHVVSVGVSRIRKSNFYGAFDMGGNAAEFTEQRKDGGFVVRGGSWKSPLSELSRRSRRVVPANYEGNDVGFRVAAAVSTR